MQRKPVKLYVEICALKYVLVNIAGCSVFVCMYVYFSKQNCLETLLILMSHNGFY